MKISRDTQITNSIYESTIDIIKHCLENSMIKESDDFFTSGGDSMGAINFLHAIESKFSIKMNLSELFSLRKINLIALRVTELVNK